jgi:alpha,alpha-trehalase
MGDVFGEVLKTPECGNITAATVNPDKKRKRSAVELGHYDSKFVKRWQK